MIVAVYTDHPEAFKSAQRQAEERERWECRPVLYDLPGYDGEPVYVEPVAAAYERADGSWVVERA